MRSFAENRFLVHENVKAAPACTLPGVQRDLHSRRPGMKSFPIENSDLVAAFRAPAGAALLASLWAITLHQYTGRDAVSFGVLSSDSTGDASHLSIVKACHVELLPEDSLSSVANRVGPQLVVDHSIPAGTPVTSSFPFDTVVGLDIEDASWMAMAEVLRRMEVSTAAWTIGSGLSRHCN